MKLTEVSSFDASKRWTIRPGAIVRFGRGGLEYRGDDGERHQMRLPGKYRVRAVYRAGRKRFRYFVEAQGLDRISGIYVVLIAGEPYRSKAGPMVRPYRVRRPKREVLTR